jgi:hypothetical protein
MVKRLSEVLAKVAELPGDKARVDYLKGLEQRYVKPVKIVLEYMFHPDRKFLLPEGAPPYKPSEWDEPAMMFNELRKLYLFVEGGHPTLKQMKREVIFTQVLEAVDPSDAELLLAIKDKRSPYEGLTRAVARQAFPDLGL